jgi:hypothetical protein
VIYNGKCDIENIYKSQNNPCSRNVISFLSMGKESLWNLKTLMKNTFFKKIVVVYINSCNKSIHYREKGKFIKFKNWFRENEIDFRVEFEEVDFGNFESKVSLEKNITIENSPIQEYICKMQYCELLLAPLIVKHQVGNITIANDFDEKDFNSKSYFSDQQVSFKSFHDFFCLILGSKINLNFKGRGISRLDKTKILLNCDWIKFVSSCYCNAQYFESRRLENRIPIELNMCGACFKCKEDKIIYEKLGLL